MSVLVTGGSGFIGRHLIKRLRLDGVEVTNVDLREGKDIHEIEREPGLFDVVVHLAAKAGVVPSVSDPAGYVQTNVVGTQRVLDFARDRGARVVFASSSSVYGSQPTPWREDMPLEALSPYAATKIAGEALCASYASSYGMTCTALRFFTVYGPQQRPGLAIRRWMEQLAAGEPVTVNYSNGEPMRRDFTFVEDVVDGIVAAMRLTTPGFLAVNVGSGRMQSLDRVVEDIADRMMVRPVIHRGDGHPCEVSKTWADTTRAQVMLGLNDPTPWSDGIGAMVDWFVRTQPQAVG